MQRNDESSVNASGARLSTPKEGLNIMGGLGRLTSPILVEVPTLEELRMIPEKEKETYCYK